MAYERTNWNNGDVISSEKLNKMEAGIEYACSLEHEVEDPTEGQVLKYDAEKEKFVNSDVPAAIETNIQNPTDGQTLKYDAASGKWVNGEGGGSGKLIVHENISGGTRTLDKTWQEIADAFPNVAYFSSPADGIEFYYPIDQVKRVETDYSVRTNEAKYTTTATDGYPSYSNPIG